MPLTVIECFTCNLPTDKCEVSQLRAELATFRASSEAPGGLVLRQSPGFFFKHLQTWGGLLCSCMGVLFVLRIPLPP